jgi:hypothetical protein
MKKRKFKFSVVNWQNETKFIVVEGRNMDEAEKSARKLYSGSKSLTYQGEVNDQ